MIRMKITILFLLACLPVASQGFSAEEDLAIAKALSNAFARVAERVRPSVVGVTVERKVKVSEEITPEEMLRRFHGGAPGEGQDGVERSVPGAGSGILLDKLGHVLTNYHVVSGKNTQLIVELHDQRQLKATVVGVDPKTDLAVIKVDAAGRALPAPAVFGNSDAIRVGNIVMAVGNPYQLKQTVTVGIVSAKNRNVPGLAQMMYQNFIQTDASINPGNSGGALVDLDGNVIGINTAIRSGGGGSDGVGFAVPVNQAKVVVEQLIANGKVTRGWLGIGIEDLSPELAEQFPNVKAGVLVNEVFPDTPAGRGGFKHGDVIVHYNDKPVDGTRTLRALVAATMPETPVKIGVVRGGKTVVLKVTIGTQPENVVAMEVPGLNIQPDPTKALSDKLGIEVQTLDRDLREKFGLKDTEGGVLVMDVKAGSAAERKGVRRGTILLEMGHKPLRSAEDFKKETAKLKDRKSVLLYIRQEKVNRYVVLQF